MKGYFLKKSNIGLRFSIMSRNITLHVKHIKVYLRSGRVFIIIRIYCYIVVSELLLTAQLIQEDITTRFQSQLVSAHSGKV